jgi:BlaI family transcriptional regulator, penicillinase repressor
MANPVRFTPRELDIMSVLWERGPSTVTDVVACLPQPLAHNTVLTLLTILEDKGYVRHSQEGRAYRFHARIGHERAGMAFLDRAIDKIFGGSVEQLLAHVIRERRMDKASLQRLRDMLDDELVQRL